MLEKRQWSSRRKLSTQKKHMKKKSQKAPMKMSSQMKAKKKKSMVSNAASKVMFGQ